MPATRAELAGEILDLSAKLAAEGWDRLRGVRLIHVLGVAMEEARRGDWLEGVGRCDALVQVLGEFVRQSPTAKRFGPVLRCANEFARLLQEGHLPEGVDRDSLPPESGAWTFVLLGEAIDADGSLTRTLGILGFGVEQRAEAAAAMALAASGNTILLAGVTWLALQAERLGAPRATGAAAPFLVAVADSADFRAQIKARQNGARLLLDAPIDAPRLIAELAGLAWNPRTPYRALLVDDEPSALAIHAEILRGAGFEVLAVDDPVAAREFLAEFSPEVCLLDVEMPACRGTDLAALLRRDQRHARLPVIYVSAHADLAHQLDARHAGGEDYLAKPVAPELLVAAAVARARQFRLLEKASRQRRLYQSQLENLKSALDAHAIVSITSADGSITYANRRFCEVSGYSHEELIGRNHRIVKSGHHPPAVFDGMWRKISLGRIWQGEVQNRCKDGSPYWVQATIVPILDAQGAPEQYVSIRTDVTEQKHVQEERERQTRLLDAIRRSVQHFILSHDLVATSSLLLDSMLLLTDSPQGFIGQVLYDADGTPYHKTHAFANVAWDPAARELYETTQQRGMEFRNLDTLFGAALRSGKPVIANDAASDPRRGGLPAGHPPLDSFLGLPIHHGDMIVGMVGLANRPGGYDLAIAEFLAPLTTTYASILEAARLRKFQEQVIDDLQRERDGAEQANRAKSDFVAGLGRELRAATNLMLGQARDLLLNPHLDADAAAQAAELLRHGEQLARRMEELTAPLDAKDRSRELPEASDATAGGAIHGATPQARRRILVAEDNPANQALLRMQLNVLGFDTDIAADGIAALAKWQSGGHDLLLTDRNMPGMDGLALARAIRAKEMESGACMPIVGITAAHLPEEVAACRDAGMDEVLSKPIELDGLRRALARWLPLGSPPAPADAEPARTVGEAGSTLDADYLSQLLGDAGTAQVRELIDLFSATVHADLPPCHQFLAAGDGRGLALTMHKLKSSARMVGASRFAGLAESLESAAQGGRLDVAATLLAELEHAVNDVEAAALDISLTEAAIPATPKAAVPNRVLVVDDDPVARLQGSLLLSALGVGDVLAVEGGEAALAELSRATTPFELVLIDLNMPGMDGIELLRRLAETNYRGNLVLCSGVEDRLLQTAADLTRAKGLNLRGTLAKPMTREALAALVALPRTQLQAARVARPVQAVSPEDINDGIRLDEFSVHFQPKVDCGTLRTVGVEALARWQHQGAAVPPDVFIRVAERHGLIAALSEQLVAKALSGGARLAAAGFPLAVAVNLSATWLTDIRLPEFIESSIAATGFKAEKLILEITETGVMADVAISLDVLTRLRLKGFKLSIDDFGTGYSSMEQLRRIPFGELKLDRGFVQGAAEKPATRAILASTLDMARKLGLATVAEGVETQADLDLVRGLGCDLVQGWLIAKAMPVEQLIDWLRQRDA